jgi:hypothetical protein
VMAARMVVRTAVLTADLKGRNSIVCCLHLKSAIQRTFRCMQRLSVRSSSHICLLHSWYKNWIQLLKRSPQCTRHHMWEQSPQLGIRTIQPHMAQCTTRRFDPLSSQNDLQHINQNTK